MLKIVLLMAGGALGTLSRYLVSGATHKYFNGSFPWGTLMVNASGALVIGFVWGIFELKDLSPHTRMFLFIGFLGGYTTFSTFALETMNLIREGDMKLAMLNVLANNLLALVFVFAGFYLSKGLITSLK